jgi:hypothetical protein
VFDSCQEIIRVKLRSNPMIITYPDKDVYCLKVLKHTYFTQSTKFRDFGLFFKTSFFHFVGKPVSLP